MHYWYHNYRYWYYKIWKTKTNKSTKHLFGGRFKAFQFSFLKIKIKMSFLLRQTHQLAIVAYKLLRIIPRNALIIFGIKIFLRHALIIFGIIIILSGQ